MPRRLAVVLPFLGILLVGGGSSVPLLRPVWKAKPGGDAGSTVLVADGGAVATVTWDGDVVVLDGRTGAERWRRRSSGDAGPEATFLAATEGLAVLGSPASRTVEVRDLVSGSMLRTVELESPPTSASGCGGYRMVAFTFRAVGPDGPGLVARALDPRTGETLWTRPVAGSLVGAGEGWLGVEVPSGTGRLPSGIGALRCTDGLPATVDLATDRAFARLAAVGDAGWLVYAFDFGFQRQLLCPVQPTDAAVDGGLVWVPSHACLDLQAPVEVGGRTLPGTGMVFATGLVRGDRAWVGTSHTLAHNLDPSPDSWLVSWDLVTGRPAAASPPLTASGPMLDLGSHLLTTFGSTGVDDMAWLVDPETLVRTGRLSTRTAPRLAAADAERAYVATYDGEILALARPSPGEVEAPVVLTPVKEEAPPAASATALALRLERTLEVLPRRATTSGNLTDGAVGDLSFLADGTRLALGGNDDRVHVVAVADGRETWRSEALGKDVEVVTACEGGRLHASIYGGRHHVWDLTTTPPRGVRKVDAGFGWMSGITDDCGSLAVHLFDDAIHVFDVATGAERGRFPVPNAPDPRGYRVTPHGLLVWADGQPTLLDPAGAAEGRIPATWLPAPAFDAEQGDLTQVWMVSGRRWLWEQCTAARCTVHVTEGDGFPARAVGFDTTGGVWVPDVPSDLSLSADGRFLFFFRDGLEPTVVHLGTEARAWLPRIPRTMSATPRGRFSPTDPTLLAVTLTPAPNQVSLYRVVEDR